MSDDKFKSHYDTVCNIIIDRIKNIQLSRELSMDELCLLARIFKVAVRKNRRIPLTDYHPMRKIVEQQEEKKTINEQE